MLYLNWDVSHTFTTLLDIRRALIDEERALVVSSSVCALYDSVFNSYSCRVII